MKILIRNNTDKTLAVADFATVLEAETAFKIIEENEGKGFRAIRLYDTTTIPLAILDDPWSKAPEWAKWLAMDGGEQPKWHWYEDQPVATGSNYWMTDGNYLAVYDDLNIGLCTALPGSASWTETLKRRPE